MKRAKYMFLGMVVLAIMIISIMLIATRNKSIAIIGGSDGPTKIYVENK